MIAKPEFANSDILLDVEFTPQNYKRTISSLSGDAYIKDGRLYGDDNSADYATLIEAPILYSFKVVFKPDSTTEKIWNTTGTVKTLATSSGVASMSGFTLYVNGVSGGTVVADVDNTIVGVSSGAFTYTAIQLAKGLHGSISQFTLYNYNLTADEALNDYEMKTYKEYINNNEILRINSSLGVIENEYAGDYLDTTQTDTVPAVVNTSVVTKRDGDIYAMFFDGADSKLDCGGYDDLTGDKTAIAWIKPFSLGEAGGGYILSNGRFLLSIFGSGSEKIAFYSDGSNIATSASNSISFNEYQLVCVTRTDAGLANIYINGKLSGSANQNSGTPVAGITNIIIGNTNVQTATFDGLISNPRIINGLLTAQEAMQIFTSERGFYNV